jgi:hypothetical protein
LRDARAGNQLLLLSRTRSRCIRARGGAAKLIYALLLFTRAHIFTAKFKRANFLRLCTTWMVGADVKSAAKASRRLMPRRLRGWLMQLCLSRSTRNANNGVVCAHEVARPPARRLRSENLDVTRAPVFNQVGKLLSSEGGQVA